jgi:hypothetical protein
MLVPTNRMGRGYPTHKVREGPGINRRQYQMPVVGKDAIRKQADRISLQSLVQHNKKGAVISRSGKQRCFSDASVRDVKE